MARFFEKITTFFFDVIAFNVALAVTFWLRYHSGVFPEALNPHADLASLEIPMLALSIAWVALFFFSGMYRDWYRESRVDEFAVVTRTVLVGMFLLFLITSGAQIIDLAKTGQFGGFFTRTKLATLLTYGGCMLFFAAGNRLVMHTLLAWLFRKGIAQNRTLIIGAGESGEKLLEDLNRFPHMGYRVVGFIDDDGRRRGTTVGGLPVMGTYKEIPAIARREKVTGIIVTDVSDSANEILRVVQYTSELRLSIFMIPTLRDVITGHLKTNQVFGIPLMVLLQDHMPAWEAQVKRVMDVAVSVAVLLLGAPVWLAFAALIRLTSKGPAVFTQERVGRNGKPFIMMKFRSMYQDAELRSGPVWATENDPRITPIGRFMRKTRVDEIPQFLNVIKGDMSLVGPRPERQHFIDTLKKEIPWYVRRLKMTPGITGWAQVKHKYDATIEDVKQKVIYDLFYFENMSILLDLKILIRTVMVVFTGKGAH